MELLPAVVDETNTKDNLVFGPFTDGATGSHLDLPQPSPLQVGEAPGKLSNKW